MVYLTLGTLAHFTLLARRAIWRVAHFKALPACAVSTADRCLICTTSAVLLSEEM